MNSMNDQKSLYSTLEIASTRRCVCGIMNDKHMAINQQFIGPRFGQNIQQNLDFFVQQMCLSNLHFGLRLMEFLIEKIGGHQLFRTDMCNGDEKKQQKKDSIRAIQTAYR